MYTQFCYIFCFVLNIFQSVVYKMAVAKCDKCVGINGFGRIGRLVLRAALSKKVQVISGTI